MRRVIVLAAAVVMLAGCASSGPTGSEILTGSIKSDLARLVIYRTSPLGFAVQPEYKVDGRAIGSSTPNGFVMCEMRPGKHDISVGNFPVNINLSGGSDTSKLVLVAGKTTYLIAQPQFGLTIGVITLTEVTEQQARMDTADLHKLDSDCRLS